MKKILIPCDFSEISDNALRYGVEMAKYFSAELLLLHVAQFPVINPEVGFAAYTYQDAERDGLEALRKQADRLKTEHGFSGNVRVQAKTGDISEEVKNYAASQSADVVIMGISGHGSAMLQTFVGSSAVTVSRIVDCPLIIVPPGITFKLPKILLYACEYEEEVRVHPGFDRIKDLATLFGAELQVVHVVKGTKPGKHEGLAYTEDKSAPGPYRTFIVGEKHAASGLLEFLKEHKTDMIVIEPKKHSWFYDIFHRSVTNEIAFHSPVPVVAVHS